MKFFFNNGSKAKAKNVATAPAIDTNAVEKTDETAEVASIIALALHMHISQLQEYEKTIITIQRAIKPYSPWSSKIYGLRQSPSITPRPASRLK